jgi:hypothetical protein
VKRLLFRHGGWILVFGSLLWLFLPSLIAHARNSLDPLQFNDDARIVIWPFFRYSDHGAAAFTNDYLADYVMATHIPVAYRILFTAGSWLWDAEPISKLLPYALLPILLAAVAIAGHAFAGKAGAWTAMALALGSEIYLERMGGGLPRAFAHPAVAVGLCAILYGRVRLAAIMVIVGAAFYPSAGLVLGIGFASSMLFVERGRLRRRLEIVAATALACAVLMIPLALGQRPYAPVAKPKDWQQYPEAGPGGTSSPLDLPPYKTLFEDVDAISRRVFFGQGEPWVRPLRGLVERGKKSALEIIALILLFGWYRLAKEDVRARRLLAFAGGIAIGHTIGRIAAPYAYVPNRYVQYGLPPLLAVMVPAAFVGLLSYVRALRVHLPIRDALVVLPCLVFMLFFGGRGSTNAGLSVHVPQDLAEIYAKIAALPEDAVIAGWPDDPMSNVPYVARRRAYMTGELHQPHHLGFLDEIRRRLRPFFEAYLARSAEPLVRLRDEQGVTHLLVDTNQLRGKAPSYMAPMGAWIQEIVEQGAGQPYELMKRIPGPAVVHQRGRWVLIDLARIEAME